MTSKRTSLHVPIALYQWLVDRAKSEGRTVSNLIIFLLEQARKSETPVKTDASKT